MRTPAWQRLAFGVLWLAAMVAVAVTTYNVLGSHRSHPRAAVVAPHQTAPLFKLPGTLYLSHKGGIYRMQDGVFSELQGPGGWSQPAMSPEGRRLAVARRNGVNYSDLYLLDPGTGRILNALTQNASSVVELNHWSFYPRFSLDGGTVFFSWDSPKDFSYRVDLAIWSVVAGMPLTRASRWTTPVEFTGGDVSPIPIKGGLLYVKYDVSPQGKSFSQIWLTSRPGNPGHALTQPGDSCAQPALSADQTRLAMVCSADQVTSRLVVADFDGNALAQPRTLVDSQLVAAPSWSPDASGLVYLAPAASAGSGHFQLWYLRLGQAAAAQSPSPSGGTAPGSPGPSTTPSPAAPPRQVTMNLDFDALSPPVWVG